jgi:hypothetical protein
MFNVKDPTLVEKLVNAISHFLRGEVLPRAFCILVGGSLSWSVFRMMVHGNFTYYNSSTRVIEFAPPVGLIGLWFLYLGVRKRSIKDAFKTHLDEDTHKKQHPDD